MIDILRNNKFQMGPNEQSIDYNDTATNNQYDMDQSKKKKSKLKNLNDSNQFNQDNVRQMSTFLNHDSPGYEG